MATNPTRSTRPRRRSTAKDNSLIDWIEPERNVRVLDWRDRAQQFGLVPVTSEDEALPAVRTSPERLLPEEESEALRDQPVLEAPDDDTDADDQEESEAVEPEEVLEAGRV